MKALKIITSLILTILINYGIYFVGHLINHGSILADYFMGIGLVSICGSLLALIIIMFLGILNLFD